MSFDVLAFVCILTDVCLIVGALGALGTLLLVMLPVRQMYAAAFDGARDGVSLSAIIWVVFLYYYMFALPLYDPLPFRSPRVDGGFFYGRFGLALTMNVCLGSLGVAATVLGKRGTWDFNFARSQTGRVVAAAVAGLVRIAQYLALMSCWIVTGSALLAVGPLFLVAHGLVFSVSSLLPRRSSRVWEPAEPREQRRKSVLRVRREQKRSRRQFARRLRANGPWVQWMVRSAVGRACLTMAAFFTTCVLSLMVPALQVSDDLEGLY